MSERKRSAEFMIHNLYLVLVIVARATGVFLILKAVLSWGTGLILTRGVGLGVPVWALLLPIVGGVLLWLVAKPCAALITRDLE